MLKCGGVFFVTRQQQRAILFYQIRLSVYLSVCLSVRHILVVYLSE